MPARSRVINNEKNEREIVWRRASAHAEMGTCLAQLGSWHENRASDLVVLLRQLHHCVFDACMFT